MGELKKNLRDFVSGVTKVSYGSCAGDPIAWENDLKLRRIREAEDALCPDRPGDRVDERPDAALEHLLEGERRRD